MQIHQELYNSLNKIPPKWKEEIRREIDKGGNAAFAKRMEEVLKDLERIVFEFDVEERMQLEGDFIRMKVASAEVISEVLNFEKDDFSIIRGHIFLEEFWRKRDEILNWANGFR